jgi:hypothetical protein
MSNSMYLKSVAVVLVLCGMSMAASAIAAEQGSKVIPDHNQQPAEANSVGKMEFRIAPRQDTLANNIAEKCINALVEKGPQAASSDEFTWFQAREGIQIPDLISEKYQGRTYVLLANKEPYIILPSQGWGLQKVYSTTGPMGRPAVGFDLDDNGSKLFYNLTKANINKPLAIIVDNKVLSVPYIKSAISKSGIIESRFTKEEVSKLADALQKGMPPVKVLGPIPAAAGFEASIERILNNNEYIDLDTGKTFTLPLPPENVTDANAMMEWVRNNGIDVQCAMTKTLGGLGGIDMLVAEPYRTAWDQISATDAVYDIARLGKADSVNIGKPTLISSMSAKADELPKTYLFKTREARVGILQLIGITQNPQTVKIQYKLVERALSNEQPASSTHPVSDPNSLPAGKGK